MLQIHLVLLWALVAVHIVGGAALFARIFKRESPWFGLIVPSLAIAMVMNFVEHGVGFSSFRWALPVTFLGSLWIIFSPKTDWRRLWLPVAAFLAAFTFTVLIHGLKPDIESVRDGRIDAHLIADYCMGETLPPTSTWEADCKQLYYYSFEHYAASVMVRLMGFDVGTGFNMAGALTSAFIFLLIGAIAWRLGGERRWVVALSMLLTAAAMTGSTAYLWLMAPANKDPDDATNLFNHFDQPRFPFDHYLSIGQMGGYDQRELLVPGYWGWIGSFHSVVAGQLLTLLAVYCVVEMVRGQKTIIPWVFGLVASLLILVCSTWGLPFIGTLFLTGAAYCLWKKLYPETWRAVFIGWGAAAVCMAPMLLYYLQMEAPGPTVPLPREQTQLVEFLVQWWPVYLPWMALLLFWRKLSPAVLIIMAMVPAFLLALEHITLSDRLDLTGKIWGYLFGAAWAVLIPSLASTRSYVTRGLLGVFVVTAGISMCFWVDYTHRTLATDNRWHMEGLGDYHTDGVKGRILQRISTLDHQVILPGECKWAYNECSSLVSFTRNYAFVADDFDCDNHFGQGLFNEAKRRADAVNDLYDAKSPDAAGFLRDHKIAAVVIWPEDRVSNDTLAKLKVQLAVYYWYDDCRNADASADDPNGGVFLPLLPDHPFRAATELTSKN